MNINIRNHSSFFKFSKRRKDIIAKSIAYILKTEKKEGLRGFKRFINKVDINDVEINLLFVDDEEMIKYNKKYFKRESSTDVIAFSMIEGEDIENNLSLGDAIISVETAKTNAYLYKHTLEEELLLLVIHAVLHLMGYKHVRKHSVMRKKEKQYFKYIMLLI